MKNEDTFQSDSPYLDEVIGIYLNILEINVSSEQHREILENYRQSMNTENKIFQCLDNNHGFDMDYANLFSKKNYIKNRNFQNIERSRSQSICYHLIRNSTEYLISLICFGKKYNEFKRIHQL